MSDIYFKILTWQLWELKSPKICIWQAGDPGEQMCSSSRNPKACKFQSESEQGQDPKTINVLVWAQRPEKTNECSSSRRLVKFLLTQPFYSI